MSFLLPLFRLVQPAVDIASNDEHEVILRNDATGLPCPPESGKRTPPPRIKSIPISLCVDEEPEPESTKRRYPPRPSWCNCSTMPHSIPSIHTANHTTRGDSRRAQTRVVESFQSSPLPSCLPPHGAERFDLLVAAAGEEVPRTSTPEQGASSPVCDGRAMVGVLAGSSSGEARGRRRNLTTCPSCGAKNPATRNQPRAASGGLHQRPAAGGLRWLTTDRGVRAHRIRPIDILYVVAYFHTEYL